jgi:hypothetical protein
VIGLRRRAATSEVTPIGLRGAALLIAEGVTAWVVVRVIVVHGVGWFPKVGSFFTSAGVPHDVHVYDGAGYDGQFVYRFALDPFSTHATDHGITLDFPAYRQQRIVTSLLSHWVAALPGITTALAIVIVNAIAAIVAMTAGVQLARDLGRRPQLGLLLGLPASLPVSLAYDLTEPVAWAGVLLAILASRRARWDLAALAFTVAILARETSAIVYIGFVAESLWVLWRRTDADRWRRLWLVLPAAVFTVWQIRLWQVWHEVPALSGFRNTGLGDKRPILGVAQHKIGNGSPFPVFGIGRAFTDGLFAGRRASAVLGTSYLVERIVLLTLIATAAWLLFTRRARPGIAITVGWSIACLLAFSLRSWSTDAQFLRAAMEAWGMSVLVLLHVDHPWVRKVLIGTAVVTLWMALVYLVRT